MKKNMGRADQIIRVAIALGIIGLMIAGVIKGTVLIVLGILAVIFLLTSLVSFCPLYLPFGLSTRRKNA